MKLAKKRTILTRAEQKAIDECLVKFREHRGIFEKFAESIVEAIINDDQLKPLVHFIKFRIKDEDSLERKLKNIFLGEARGTPPSITEANLFEEIHDLAGVRVLHLHTNQLSEFVECIPRIATEASLKIVDGPTGYCWDVEYASLFGDLGIRVVERHSMYSTVHYSLQMNEKTKFKAELQVRTLTEELWAEVSHRVIYTQEVPDPINDMQVKVLARLTSGSTRLVDTIFDVSKMRS